MTYTQHLNTSSTLCATMQGTLMPIMYILGVATIMAVFEDSSFHIDTQTVNKGRDLEQSSTERCAPISLDSP